MKRQEISIRFADLRRLASTVPAYLADKSGEQLPVSLTTRIEADLSLTGDDLVELVEDFTKTYCVDAANFDFTGLITPEGLDSLSIISFFLGALYLLVGWTLKILSGLLCYPFDNAFAKRIWQQQLPRFWLPSNEQIQPKPLTAGDFVASAAVGWFVKREQVYFQLVR